MESLFVRPSSFSTTVFSSESTLEVNVSHFCSILVICSLIALMKSNMPGWLKDSCGYVGCAVATVCSIKGMGMFSLDAGLVVKYGKPSLSALC